MGKNKKKSSMHSGGKVKQAKNKKNKLGRKEKTRLRNKWTKDLVEAGVLAAWGSPHQTLTLQDLKVSMSNKPGSAWIDVLGKDFHKAIKGYFGSGVREFFSSSPLFVIDREGPGGKQDLVGLSAAGQAAATFDGTLRDRLHIVRRTLADTWGKQQCTAAAMQWCNNALGMAVLACWDGPSEVLQIDKLITRLNVAKARGAFDALKGRFGNLHGYLAQCDLFEVDFDYPRQVRLTTVGQEAANFEARVPCSNLFGARLQRLEAIARSRLDDSFGAHTHDALPEEEENEDNSEFAEESEDDVDWHGTADSKDEDSAKDEDEDGAPE